MSSAFEAPRGINPQSAEHDAQALLAAQAEEKALLEAGFVHNHNFDPDDLSSVPILAITSDMWEKSFSEETRDTAEKCAAILEKHFGDGNVAVIPGFIRQGDIKTTHFTGGGVMQEGVDVRLKALTQQHAAIYTRFDDSAISSMRETWWSLVKDSWSEHFKAD